MFVEDKKTTGSRFVGMFNVRVSNGVNGIEEIALNEHTDTDTEGVVRLYQLNGD